MRNVFKMQSPIICHDEHWIMSIIKEPLPTKSHTYSIRHKTTWRFIREERGEPFLGSGCQMHRSVKAYLGSPMPAWFERYSAASQASLLFQNVNLSIKCKLGAMFAVQDWCGDNFLRLLRLSPPVDCPCKSAFMEKKMSLLWHTVFQNCGHNSISMVRSSSLFMITSSLIFLDR